MARGPLLFARVVRPIRSIWQRFAFMVLIGMAFTLMIADEVEIKFFIDSCWGTVGNEKVLGKTLNQEDLLKFQRIDGVQWKIQSTSLPNEVELILQGFENFFKYVALFAIILGIINFIINISVNFTKYF